MTPKINILLPVETMNRDLDFRLMLAGLVVHRGNRIFIGQHDTVHRLVEQLEGGIYLGKNVFNKEFQPDTDLTRYRALKRRRITLIHLDEEGGVFPSDDPEAYKALLRLRLDPGCLAAEDYVCTWGDFQRDYYRSIGGASADNVRTTGHPRFDLYRPAYRAYWEDDVAALRARFGRFILVNTSYVTANNGLGHADTFGKRLNYYHPEDPKAWLDYVNYWAHNSTLMANMVRLVTRLSVAFPRVQIVLRPHPTEDWSFYEVIFGQVDNVHVLHEGPVSPWVLACKVLIQDGCTTAIEGFLAGTNVITHKSVTDARFDVSLSNLFGVQCRTEEEVIERTGAMIASDARPDPQPLPPGATDLMVNLAGEAFPALLAVLAEAEAKLGGAFRAPSVGRIVYAEAIEDAIAGAKRVARAFFPARARAYRFFRRQHFYGFDQSSIARKLRRVQQMTGKTLVHRVYSHRLLAIEMST